MTVTLDQFVIAHAPGPLAELHPALVRARMELDALLRSLASIGDASLRVAWDWDANDVDIRYAFYRAVEAIESASAAAVVAVSGSASTEAREAVGAATHARWDLHGLLVTLADGDLDDDPGDGEWTIRQTVAHITNSQRGYAWGTAYWLSTRDQPREDGPLRVPEDVFAGFPDETDEAVGSLSQVRKQLDDVVDATSSRFATLADDDLAVTGGWSGIRVSIGFRQWRWSSHIQEHTVQVEKTLDMLGRRSSEVQRLVRLVARAYGRLESVVYYRPLADLELLGRTSTSAAEVLDAVAGNLHRIGDTVRIALAAGVPATREW